MSVPELTLYPGDIEVIAQTLRPYAAYVRKHQQPSAGRALLLVTIENLIARLASLKRGPEGQAVFLSPMELHIIDQALAVFIRMVPTVVKRSKERDGILSACQNLKMSLQSQLSTQ